MRIPPSLGLLAQANSLLPYDSEYIPHYHITIHNYHDIAAAHNIITTAGSSFSYPGTIGARRSPESYFILSRIILRDRRSLGFRINARFLFAGGAL